ncbi:MAG: hypothetical protein FJ387_03385 [Verrucomicrobia bacterium]|nr:hypothetical protein [Verrucomicrobiota bacterium]
MKATSSWFTPICLGTALLLGSSTVLGLPLITDVVETGGDNEPTDTILAKWTGITWNTTVANEPTPNTPVGTPFTVPTFGEDVPAYVDRNHQWNGATATLPLPAYLVGGEYIMSGNDNRDNASYRLDITVSEAALVYVLVDNRLSDGAGGDPPEGGLPVEWWVGMAWMALEGYQPVLNGLNRVGDPLIPDEIGVDEGGDGVGPGAGINQYSSVYFKEVPAGTFSIYQADNAGRNMYGVVIKPLPTSASNPPVITGVVPANNTLFYGAGGGLRFEATTVAPNRLDAANIRLTLNGTDVSGALTIGGSNTSRTAAYSGLMANQVYTARITVSDQAGRSATQDLTFDTFDPAVAVTVDAEDYNYESGRTLANPVPAGYANLAGTAEIDYHDLNTATTAAEYRFSDFVGLAVSTDGARPGYVAGVATDYQVTSFLAGDWLNYTRSFPDKVYQVYLRASAGSPQRVRLDRVGGNPTTANQTLFGLGTFVVPRTTNPFEYIPLTDAAGQPVVVPMAGATTVRLTGLRSPTPGPTLNFLLFVPVSAPEGPPYVGTVSPGVDAADVALDAVVRATIVNGVKTVATGSVRLTFNGSDVTGATTVTPGAAGVEVTYDPPGLLSIDTSYAAQLSFQDTAGGGHTSAWTFRTLAYKPIITSVTELWGDDSVNTPAQYTGQTFSHPNLGAITLGTFQEDVPAYRDRTHQWNGVTAALPLPSYLVGGEYIMSRNDNRDNNPYELAVRVTEPALVYLLVDNRLTDGDGANPPESGNPLDQWLAMYWLGLDGFTPVRNGLNRTANFAIPDEVGVDEGGDGVGPGVAMNNYASVYVREVPAGIFTLYAAENAGRNMYGVVVRSVASHAFTPAISITSPADQATFATAPADIPLTVNASVRNSTIAKVEYYQGVLNQQKIGEATTAPYTLAWPGVGAGRYTLRAKAFSAAGASAVSAPVTIVVGKVISVNFQASTAEVPPGYLPDYGYIFADQGNGYSYGWDDDNTAHARDRNDTRSPDERYDTFNHMQKTDPLPAGRVWEIAVPNGRYGVQVVVGEASNFDSVYDLQAEGTTIVQGTPTTDVRWFEATAVVTVSDGRLSLGNGPLAANNKVGFVDIATLPAEVPRPVLTARLVGGTLTVTWTHAGKLQEAGSVTGLWADVAGNPQGTYSVSATEPRKFYRVIVP